MRFFCPHTAARLGAAELLQRRRGELRGNVKLFFQPDEEGDGGAARMIAAGGSKISISASTPIPAARPETMERKSSFTRSRAAPPMVRRMPVNRASSADPAALPLAAALHVRMAVDYLMEGEGWA